MTASAYIFAYGSLVDPDDHLYAGRDIEPIYGILGGFERHWRVAFDNLDRRRDRKHYLRYGRRYRGCLSMLGITPLEGAFCNGVAVPVDDELDQQIAVREGRLYSRSEDLCQSFSVELDGPLFAWIPIPSGRDLYYRALDQGQLALPSSYVETVERAFRSWGPQALKTYRQSTAPARAPLRQLEFFREPGAL